MRHCLLVIWMVLLLSPVWIRGQPVSYPFTRIGTREGLSSNDINAIFKDSKGFMWFGTISGLNRYDGHDFRLFRHDAKDNSSIGENNISSIAEGPARQLWIRFTDSTFNIYDPNTESFNRDYASALKRLSIPDPGISAIVKDGKGRFCFVHPSLGIFVYDGKTGKTIKMPVDPGEPSIQEDNITDCAVDHMGYYWIVRRNGLLEELDGNDFHLVYHSGVIPQANHNDPLAYNLFADAQGDLWIYSTGDARGIYYFKGSDHTFLHLDKSQGNTRLNNDIVKDVVQDEAGQIWIGTDHGGINLLNKSNFSIRYLEHSDFDENSLSQNAVICLYRDNEGLVWIGTYKQGMNCYHPGGLRFPLYRHHPLDPNSLGYDDVDRFVEDAKGNCWIGTNGGGLIYFDRKLNKFTSFLHQPGNPNSLSNDVIISMCMDHEGKLWVGSYFGGLDCYDGKTFTHYRHDPQDPHSLEDDRVWEIFEDKWHQLWVGMLAGGLDLMDREHGRFIHHLNTDQPTTIHSNYISELTQDTAGNLWVGTAVGIDVLDHQSGLFHHFGKRDGLSSDFILTIVPDSLGRVWVGTSEGLNLLDPASGKTLRTWTREDGLPDNYILTTEEDARHNLWIGTPNGLCNCVVHGGGKDTPPTLQCINYDESNGLQSRQFNENAAYRMKGGELLFGGPGGFNLFNPVLLGKGQETPSVVFTNLQIFNKSIVPGEKIHGRVLLKAALPETGEITLRYNENVFAISFADLDYGGNQKTTYSYRLEGFNPDWLATSALQRSATYTNLDPGTYVFMVRANPASGIGPSGETSLVIHILPPFWRTPIAYILYALFIIGLLLLSRNILVQRTRMRFRIEQERKEAQQMHELDMMKIRFFTNVSHEFRTPLSLILAPLEKLLTQTEHPEQRQFHLIYRNARRLLNLVNQLLDFRKMEVQEFTLSRSRGNIISFVRELVFSFSDISEKRHIRLDFASSLPECFTLFDRDKLEKIVFNLLSNAFKFTPESGSVKVSVAILHSKPLSFVEIRVADTGIGIPVDQQDRIFERFFQHELPGNMLNQGSGIGLALTREFVKLHEGAITVESEGEKGSCFIVRLPLLDHAPEAAPEDAFQSQESKEVFHAEESENVFLAREAPEEEVRKGRKPTILLVEDNEDFRFYLKDNLKAYYHIVEAANGKEGWGRVQSAQPDLVVSDIMMPEMNGIALAKRIKGDPHTSHIPVILLTARADEEQQLEGYETGANDYITKPFNFELLLARIRNLVAQRKAIHNLFQKHADIPTSTVAISSLDEQFLKQAVSVVEEHLSNAGFSVEDLSRAVHLSRATLYKKLLSLTGKAPLDFIRHIRLKRASDLLSKSQLTVAEIAYEVGFNDPKYFAKFFKKEFGLQPSVYKQKSKDAGNEGRIISESPA